ncbi:DNA cytosine methyltransferase [Bradyrhizobium lablabi]|uniref:DNA cytosine methyltransferase n=1 Tax=Bradyrhizobium lablabi TaxID=722472 RepID=UPI001BA92CE6|nr:DNA cytosine methyltransferase [Bradyrhizobium lablabi]MBR0695146.1 DNA cytosine methyltransferase [Bradyrhizobium lablabi]
MGRPIGIDLFAGAGGMSLGFEQAGFDVKAAVEIDPIHCAVHKFNFPDCAVLPQSVQELTGADIRRAAGIGNAPVDVVFGGPPCQGFSLIGHRSLDDPRNHLVLDFVRIVAELKAKTFVFENVKGLTVGRQKSFLSELIKAFEEVGYNVRTDWQVLNAARYGVPQYRERLILLGAKRGVKVPEYPPRATFPADAEAVELEDHRLPAGPTCKDALGDLPDADAFEELDIGDAVRAKFGKPSDYAAELRCLTNDAWHYGYLRKWNPGLLTSSAKTEHTEISKRRFAATEPGSVEPISRFFKLDANGLSNTLRAGTDGARGAFTSPRPIHYARDRCVTVREMARLHGFPDWFRFHATKWHGARQIGNSVPPPLARAVAREVMKALGIRPRRPTREIELGEEMLLNLVLAQAADHFEVAKPNSKRDRKSGAKKRKQVETEAARLASLEAFRG